MLNVPVSQSPIIDIMSGSTLRISPDVVERFFNRMKNWRGLARRYDKHALVYRGVVVLAAILDWLT